MKRATLTLLTILALFAAAPAAADVVTLDHLNSSATIDTDAGMYTWSVNSIDHMYLQWFWYRIGETAEQGINALDATPDVDFSARTLTVTYTGAQLTAEIFYRLTGANIGVNKSDITEQISITNTSGAALDLHFFQYSDFDVGGAGGDYAKFANDNTVIQWDPSFVLSEVSDVPIPNRHEIAPYAGIISRLTDGAPDNLANGLGQGLGVTHGPGDMTWAFQWDVTLVAGDSLLISKNKNIGPVPEPATMALMGGALLLFSHLALRRRKKS